jgi:ABC-type bacteriocin/lantibiotic exporter with double-glycine peptidase domain
VGLHFAGTYGVNNSAIGVGTLKALLRGLFDGPGANDELRQTLEAEAEIILRGPMLRSQFGVVLQESSLFSGSIRRNIAINNPELSLDQIVSAAQLAHIHDEIMDMPMAYETMLAEVGLNISGGQRQRISIARAVAHRPALLLLDEATSHLDVVTERLVSENLEGLECTRIVIAHRLSTIINADVIIVLDKGAIVEQGSHEQLLAKNGIYAGLISGEYPVSTHFDPVDRRNLFKQT